MNKNIKYSQNFLTSEKVLNQIIKQLNLSLNNINNIKMLESELEEKKKRKKKKKINGIIYLREKNSYILQKNEFDTIRIE